jgi:hypothetical protein
MRDGLKNGHGEVLFECCNVIIGNFCPTATTALPNTLDFEGKSHSKIADFSCHLLNTASVVSVTFP